MNINEQYEAKKHHNCNVECSLLSRYQQAIEAISAGSNEIARDDDTNVLRILLDVRTRINSLDIISKNESLLDIPTFNLPFISIQYHIAMAYLATSRSTEQRYTNLNRAVDLFHSFLRKIDEIMSSSEGEEGERLYRANNVRSEYHSLLNTLDEEEEEQQQQKDWMRAAETSRQDKIARLKRRRILENDIERLLCLVKRDNVSSSWVRTRQQDDNINNDVNKSNVYYNEEEEDDDESIKREMYTKQLILYCILAIEELYECRKEMEMLKIAMQMERQKQLHQNTSAEQTSSKKEHSMNESLQQRGSSRISKPIELTHVSQDPVTGKLIFQKEKIQSNVFRPSWNLPTVTLAQLGDQQRLEAIERSQQQKEVEEQSMLQPKRYDQLVADGLEDDSNLVDASAVLDRKWDDFKDENPRGSGNKMGDRGDRNF